MYKLDAAAARDFCYRHYIYRAEGVAPGRVHFPHMKAAMNVTVIVVHACMHADANSREIRVNYEIRPAEQVHCRIAASPVAAPLGADNYHRLRYILEHERQRSGRVMN